MAVSGKTVETEALAPWITGVFAFCKNQRWESAVSG